MAEKNITLTPAFWETAAKLWAQKCDYVVDEALTIVPIDHDEEPKLDFYPFDLNDI